MKENLVNKMQKLWGTAIVIPNMAIYYHKLFSQFLQKMVLDWKGIRDEGGSWEYDQSFSTGLV